MASRKAEHTKAKRVIAKPDSAEKREGKSMPTSARMDIVRVEQHSVEQRYEEILPPSKELAGYKKVQKDLPERLMRLMEKEHDQMTKENDSLHNYFQARGVADSRRKDKAQWFSFILSLVIVGAVAVDPDKGWLLIFVGFMALPFLIGGYFGRLTDFFAKGKDKKK